VVPPAKTGGMRRAWRMIQARSGREPFRENTSKQDGMNIVRWNLSSRAGAFRQADAFVVSFPKSGRTWVRVFLHAYMAAVDGRPFSLEFDQFTPGRFPRVFFTHDRFEHHALGNWWSRLRGRHLIPGRDRRTKRVFLLARDPRDVVVSHYFHLSRRRHAFRFRPQSLSSMLRNRRFGIGPVIGTLNGWLAEWDGRANFMRLRYEDLQAEPVAGFAAVLAFLGFAPVNEAALAHGVNFSRFDNMQVMEASGRFAVPELSPGMAGDVDSFKTRRGKVGGFRDYFTVADLQYANRAMQRLDRRFGYDAGEVAAAAGHSAGPRERRGSSPVLVRRGPAERGSGSGRGAAGG
jgi:Sulfotransferase domain